MFLVVSGEDVSGTFPPLYLFMYLFQFSSIDVFFFQIQDVKMYHE